MKTVTVKPNQTIFDIAVEQYGTCEAIAEIMSNNPGIRNDKAALSALGIDYLSDTDFYADVTVEPGFQFLVNTDSRLIKTNVIKEINTDVTTSEPLGAIMNERK